MGQTSSKVLLNGLLLTTSFGCLTRCSRRMKYARACYRLYIALAIMRICSSFSHAPWLQDVEEVTWVWCYVFGLPLLATDMSSLSAYAPDISPLHLMIPIYTIIAFHTYPTKVDAMLLTMSHSLSIMFLAICSVGHRNLPGFLVSFIHFHSMFRLRNDEEAMNWWAFKMILCNFLISLMLQ